MAFWNETRSGSRFSLDDAARSGDRLLNWVILAMLAAFIYALWPTAAWGPSFNNATSGAPITAPPVPTAPPVAGPAAHAKP